MSYFADQIEPAEGQRRALQSASILQKLMSKSWHELANAAVERWKRKILPLRERVAFQTQSGAFQPGHHVKGYPGDAAAVRRILLQPNRPSYMVRPEDHPSMLTALKQNHPSETSELLARAERLLAGDFSEFCPLATEPQLPFPRWHHDLTTGAVWPLRWARSIDYSSDKRPGEIRHLWDLHRQLFLPALAQAWLVSRDRRFLERLAALYYNWWRCNPLGRGIAWIGPQIQEHAIRNVQWIACLELLLPDEDVPAGLLADLLQGICLQTQVLDWHYKDDKPVSHNHLVSESLGLWMPGLLYPSLPRAARWRQRGGTGLRRALDLQFGADGLQKEWTTNYHCFVLESALLARCLCAANGDPLLDGLDERLALAARFAARATQPDGRIPYLGDADDALVYLWSARPHENRRRYAASLALILDQPELAREAGQLPAESLWLCGAHVPERWQALQERAHSISDVSVHPGLNTVIQRDEARGDWLLFQGGPSTIEARVGASHLHADRNSVLLWLDGQEVLVDPGTWLYNGSAEARHHLRATRSHNTASLEGRDQCDLAQGRFAVADLPTTEALLWADSPLLAVGSTTSRAGRHVRQVAWQWRTLFLLDEVEGQGHWAEASFITPPLTTSNSWHLWALDEKGDVLPVQEGQQPWAGGRSRRYGVLEPARRLESRSEQRNEAGVFVLRHILLPANLPLPARLPAEGRQALALAFPTGLLAEPGWRGSWNGRGLENATGRLLWCTDEQFCCAGPVGTMELAVPNREVLCVVVTGNQLQIRNDAR
jgi:hypothetical protein